MNFKRVYTKTGSRGIARGCALCKVDDNVVFYSGSSGVGMTLWGAKIPPWNLECIVRAKLNEAYVEPRMLKGLKCFYRFYQDADKNGKLRPYLFLAARMDDQDMRGGSAQVILSTEGPFLVPDLRWKTMIRRIVQAARSSEMNEDALETELSRLGISWEEAVEMESRF